MTDEASRNASPPVEPHVIEEAYEDVAVLIIHRPPVNALNGRVRSELIEHLRRAEGDGRIRGVVLCGRGLHFSAGADLREFDAPAPPYAPTLPAVIEALERSPLPVVAALHGTVAGGALELTLGCHARVASPDARFSLPEVTLGFVPGAGATQRLPRLVGLDAALDLILSGRRITPAEARDLGLIDEVAGDPIGSAVQLARRLADQARRRTRDLAVPAPDPGIFEKYERTVLARARGRAAPRAAFDCVRNGLPLPFDQGLHQEREAFLVTVRGPEARALRHLFLAERAAQQVDRSAPASFPPVRTAGVVGFGTMGRGIALAFANAGIPVCVADIGKHAVAAGLEYVRQHYETLAARGRVSLADAAHRVNLITGSDDLNALSAADVVIEAVFEEMAVKREVLARLEAVCSPDAILATNTSSLDVREIAEASRTPGRVIGMHFFSPAHVMSLVEIIAPPSVSQAVLARTRALARTLGKIGVVVGVCDGFVGNRMLFAYRQQADLLLEDGALPEEIDRALTAFGMAMGPYQTGDLAGLDISWRIRKSKAATRPPHLRYPARIADALCEMGRFGQKTGAGWYRYEPGDRTPRPDPLVATLVETMAAERGIARRRVDAAEIVERCLCALVNEGAHILAEGITGRAGDIDVIWVHGYGFPAHRGGPMYWAANIGFRTVLDVVERLHAKQGELIVPAPLLRSLGDAGAAEWPS